MAVLPTKQENGRKVLETYSELNSRPGDVLRTNNFMAIAVQRRWEMSDVADGLEYAVDQGWIEERNGAFRLTDAGFAAM